MSGLLLVGCNDLDTEPMGNIVTSTQKEEVVEATPEMLDASVSAITANFTQFALTSGGHNDFGYPALMMFMDSRGMDMPGMAIGYNWFSAPLTYSDVSNTGDATYQFWATLYNQIYTANSVIKVVAEDTEEAQLQYYRAQAHAIRAFDYFNLVQMYQHTYIGHESALAVPIITEANADEAASVGCAASTVEEVYAFILNDLDKAQTMLEKSGLQRPDKRYVNVDVVRAIRARVYMVMHRWAEAAADAEAVITNSGATPASLATVSRPGFNEITDANWIWGVLITDKDRVTTTGICNFPSHMGSLTNGYATAGAWRKINKKLFNSIPLTDVRRGWWIDENCYSPNLNSNELNYLAAYEAPAYSVVKFAPYGNTAGESTNPCDVPLVRVEEMILTLAEAKAMSGDAPGGAALLENFVKTYRNPSYSCTASTPEAVQDEVWHQRRIELWGEGFSYFDMIRLQKPMDRRGGGFPKACVYNIPANDATLIYYYPHSETEANKLLPLATPPTVPSAVADI